MILLLLVCLALACLALILHPRPKPSTRRRRPAEVGESRSRRYRPKPPWVRDEVIRLKALMPHASVRTVATTFNAPWRRKRGESVAKTWVAKTIEAHQLEIVRKRAEIKKRRPRPMEKNRVWALDLTYLPDIEGKPTPILGLIDHGSRACLPT